MRLAFVFAAILVTACGQSVDSESYLSAQMSAEDPYPSSPHESLTPGSTCKTPSEYRYPDRIAYCARSVSSSHKNSIIKTYDRTFDYKIGNMPRNDFKIDHYIPLCMGGSNETANLWPQHKSVYVRTDGLEQKLCMHLERGHIKQAEAIDYMKYAKNNLDEAKRIHQEVDATFGHI